MSALPQATLVLVVRATALAHPPASGVVTSGVDWELRSSPGSSLSSDAVARLLRAIADEVEAE